MTWLRNAAIALGLLGIACSSNPPGAHSAGERGLHLTDSTPKSTGVHRFWAVAIGVSEYQFADRGIANLAYADDDARAIASMIGAPAFGAGGVPPERLRLLVDEEATLANVRAALLEFLGQASRDDVVVIFFAGHGTPDPARRDDLYLVMHDTDPSRLATTALPMREVAHAIERIRADRVLLFADACHSAGIAPPGVRLRAGLDDNPVHRFLSDLSRVRANRLVVTSSETNQTSLEGEKWGHGVFTWALLGGLRGEADRAGNRDGIVQLGETIDYLRNQVETATGLTQQPVVAGEYDGRLPLALVGGPAVAAEPQDLRAPPPAVAENDRVDLGTVDIGSRGHHTRPSALFLISRRAAKITIEADDRRRAAPAMGAATDAWLKATASLRRANEARAKAMGALEEEWRVKLDAAPKDASLEASFQRERRALLARHGPTVDAALRDERTTAARARRAIETELGADATKVPGAYWLVLAEIDLAELDEQYMRAMDRYDERLAAGEHDAEPPEPIDYSSTIAIVSELLDRFRTHALRPEALYLRAYLAQEMGAPPLEVAGHCLQATAEYPNHAYGPELYFRMAEVYFDEADPRLSMLAREGYAAALDRSAPGHFMKPLSLYKLAWTLLRQGDLRGAAGRFVQLLAEMPTSELAPESRAYLAAITAELADLAVVEGSSLGAAMKAETVAQSAALGAIVGDMQIAASWYERALALDENHAKAPSWDLGLVAALEALGRHDEASARLETRFARFGPASAWYRTHGTSQPHDFSKALAADVVRAEEIRRAPSAPRGTVDAGRAFVHRMAGGFERCADAERARLPTLAGRLSLELQWDDAGSIVAARATHNLTGSEALARCVETAAAQGKLIGARAGAGRAELVFRNIP
jgi:uncharacterized caspase-like protein/tetratricopeptide (TPR) repeat protein